MTPEQLALFEQAKEQVVKAMSGFIGRPIDRDMLCEFYLKHLEFFSSAGKISAKQLREWGAAVPESINDDVMGVLRITDVKMHDDVPECVLESDGCLALADVFSDEKMHMSLTWMPELEYIEIKCVI